MSAPVVATYRLQLRNGFDLDAAAAVAPYVAGLGASHLYLSPVWRATPGSTHGYDVCDHNEIEPAIGGRPAFDRLAAACRAVGLGVVLDIVPNHMAASPDNPWWSDVLAWGRESRFARCFDIDWTAERLLLPILGAPYTEALEAGHFRAVRAGDRFAMQVYDRRLPLTPPSWALILAAGPADLSDAALALAATTADAADGVAAILAALPPDALDAAAAAVNADAQALHRLHEAQPWRLAHWRMAREALTYRRFFEVTDLVGVRVERSDVFDDVHRLTLELLRDGAVAGLRVDHVDGLADPAAYLRRLREASGPDTPIWVEKIVHEGEELKPDWPVDGTTGYEFARDMAGLMTDPAGEAALDAAWLAVVGPQPGYDAMVDEAKRFILTHNLATELETLTSMAATLARRSLSTRDLGRDTLRRSIIAIARRLPRYRTYVSVAGVDAEDRALIADAVREAKDTWEIENAIGVDFIGDLLLLAVEDPEDRAAALAFSTRFQQVTGPVTAKAVEDTVFYRFNRLIGLNEVGGAPERFGVDPAETGRALARRTVAAPRALNAATTHDTKRGEDARARLYSLSLAPERWGRAVADLRPGLATFWDGPPDPGVEWLFLQALLGAWPGGGSEPEDDLADRVAAFLLKAVREAKAVTSWTRVDAAYEARLEAFARAALDPSSGAGFRAAFGAVAAPFIAAGEIVGLAQHALRLLAPGAPDIYQGSEAGDFSMVDPDNRRPVDFAALRAGPSGHAGRKLALTRVALALRRREPALFAEGACAPLVTADPDRVFGFARVLGDAGVGVVAPIRSAVAALAGLRDAAPSPVVRLGLSTPLRSVTPIEPAVSIAVENGALASPSLAQPLIFSFRLR